MLNPDMFTSFAVCGTASLLGLGIMSAVRVDQSRTQYALTLYRWGFLFIATALGAALAPAERVSLVVQAVLGCVGMGVVLFGWASRQLQGRRTPPWVGLGMTSLTGLALWLGAWGLQGQGYVLVLDGVFTLITVLILVDQAWVILRGARVSYSEWVFLFLMAIHAMNWLILLIHALGELGPYPTHWLYGPAWWMPGCNVVISLLPLTTAAAVFSMINERLVAQLQTRALSDELTGALSRRGLRELGERMLMSLRRPATQMAVLMLDVDHFKRINDTYGHLVGDDVLRHLVNVIQDRLRDDALLARYGGEEFVVLLPIRQRHEAQIVAERLRHAIEATPAQTTAGLVKLSISVGVAFHRPDLTLEQTLAAADARLYEAKQAGRNQVVVDEAEEAAPTLPPSQEV
ncbi:MAG: GGDEF domain-containing protein, partial [Burkholderiales bacterium]|nr:GGDEF domain-containing protein [Burkholderiales bacterium]